VVSPDDRRRDEVTRLETELAVEEQRRQRAEAALGPPRLRDRNRFFSGLLHGDLNTLERAEGLRQEIRRSAENVVRIRAKLAALRRDIDPRPTEMPSSDLDRKALSAKVRRETKARRSAVHLLAVIRKTRKRIDQATKHRVGDEASRSVVDQDAKEVAALLGDVRRGVAKLKGRTPMGLSSNLDSDARLHVRFSGSAVDDTVRAEEYKDVTLALGALATKVEALRVKLVFRETEAKRVKRAGSR
jgi:hypothetical protein